MRLCLGLRLRLGLGLGLSLSPRLGTLLGQMSSLLLPDLGYTAMDDDQTASLSHVGILNSLSSRAALLLGLVERAFKAHGEARATWLRQAALEGI